MQLRLDVDRNVLGMHPPSCIIVIAPDSMHRFIIYITYTHGRNICAGPTYIWLRNPMLSYSCDGSCWNSSQRLYLHLISYILYVLRVSGHYTTLNGVSNVAYLPMVSLCSHSCTFIIQGWWVYLWFGRKGYMATVWWLCRTHKGCFISIVTIIELFLCTLLVYVWRHSIRQMMFDVLYLNLFNYLTLKISRPCIILVNIYHWPLS
jgi:hypothetical protein